MGGMAALEEVGIETMASHLTNQAAPSRDLLPAAVSLDLERPASIAVGVEAFYPGPGHTIDNIVVYVADARVLFGGCLIRPGASTTLGNTDDADVAEWSSSVERAAERYTTAEIVVPSHGSWAGRELLDHTARLAREADDGLPEQP